MTPPPTMTTCARSGSGAVDICPYLSVLSPPPARRRETGEVGALELVDSTVVTLHGPPPEVEVQWAGAILDAAPQCPAVLADNALQPSTGELVPQPPAVVGGHQLVELLQGQLTFGPRVAQLEAGIVVAGIFVVDQPQLVAVLDEVGGQQVVVAWNGRLVGAVSTRWMSSNLSAKSR